jgi:hypothetical protein
LDGVGSTTIGGVLLTIGSSGVAPAAGPGAGGLPAALGATANPGANGEAYLTAFGNFSLVLDEA